MKNANWEVAFQSSTSKTWATMDRKLYLTLREKFGKYKVELQNPADQPLITRYFETKEKAEKYCQMLMKNPILQQFDKIEAMRGM